MSAEFDINLNVLRTFGTYLFVCKPKSSAYLRVALGTWGCTSTSDPLLGLFLALPHATQRQH
jgi:hypothetical protein